jgi:CBS domain-containing protein
VRRDPRDDRAGGADRAGRGVGSLPVVERGKVLGIVTERDVLKAVAATLPAIRGLDPDTYLP